MPLAGCQPVGNSGASNVLKVDRARIVEWVRKAKQLSGKVSSNPKLAKAKHVNAGAKPSTANIEEALVDYVNDQRKQHCGCGREEVMKKLLELKPDARGGLPAGAKPDEALAFRAKFKNWYKCFSKRHRFSIRRRTIVGQKLPKGHEDMA